MAILDRIIDEARKSKKTVVLPEGHDPRTVRAAAGIVARGIARVALLGKPATVGKIAGDESVSLDGVQVIDWLTDPRIEPYAERLAEIRKSKGMTKDAALAQLVDPLCFGVMMVKAGDADGMVAGAVNSTANTLRPALQILKTAPGAKIVSSCFLMEVPDCQLGADGTFVFADCALIECPTAEEMADIAIASARSFKAFACQEPIVAMLSYSTYGSAKSEYTAKVVEATRIAKEKAPGLVIDGEFQLDAAIVSSVGAQKAAGSSVAGKANVLVFPDLNSGNIGYKLTQRLGKAEAYGPIMQGLAKPVNDLSRGCSAEDIIGVAAFTAVQAAQQEA